MEPVGLKSYMLIRVGLDVREEEWFGLRLEPPEEERAKGGLEEKPETMGGGDSEEGPYAGNGQNWAIHPLRSLRLHGMRRRNRRLEERRRHAAEQEKERLVAEWKERVRQADLAMGMLEAEVLELAEERRSCRIVYEGTVRKALVGGRDEKNPGQALQGRELGEGKGRRRERVLADLWRRHLDMEEFQDYTRRFWVERLMSHVGQCHYVILGTASCIYEVIEEHADRMRSLRWMLLEADCGQELLDFVEDFYTEYGLAIEMQTFQSAETFRRVRSVCRQPSNIIDFTGDACLFAAEAAEGSVWLDMQSSEEKRYRLQGRKSGVEYISLKEEWKRAKRRCNAPDIEGRHKFILS